MDHPGRHFTSCLREFCTVRIEIVDGIFDRIENQPICGRQAAAAFVKPFDSCIEIVPVVIAFPIILIVAFHVAPLFKLYPDIIAKYMPDIADRVFPIVSRIFAPFLTGEPLTSGCRRQNFERAVVKLTTRERWAIHAAC